MLGRVIHVADQPGVRRESGRTGPIVAVSGKAGREPADRAAERRGHRGRNLVERRERHVHGIWPGGEVLGAGARANFLCGVLAVVAGQVHVG